MTKTLFAIAFGAGLLLTGSWGANAQGLGIFDTERDCATDVQSLCGGIKPGHGHIMACLQAHVGELSVGCSTICRRRSGSPGNAQLIFINSALTPHLATSPTACDRISARLAAPASRRSRT
jgi:hypothetical protein